MPLNRRTFLSTTAALGAAGFWSPTSFAQAPGARRYKAVAFDAFPVFDPRPVGLLAEQLFPGRGQELGNLWRTRQFEYTWLRSLSRRYVDFRQITSDALIQASRALKLEMTASMRTALVDAFSALQPWPDVRAALTRLRAAGLRLGFLSNFTAEMLAANIRRSGLDGMFEQVLSTDRVRVFKPAPEAYQMAIDGFRMRSDEIVFAAFAGWDAAGAKTFGYPTFWVNRMGADAEELGAAPDGAGDMTKLVEFVLAAPR